MNFFLLWTSSAISLLGTWTLRIALPVSVLRLTGSPGDVAAVSVAGLLGGVAVGWAAGAWVDRWDRRRVLIGGNAVQTLIVLLLLTSGTTPPLGLVIGVAAAESAVAQFLQPAEIALVPRVVAPERLTSANAWLGVVANAARLLGPVLGGVVAAVAGLAGAAGIDAATFAVAALLCAGISGSHRVVPGPEASGMLRELREGWTALWSRPVVRAILLLLAVSGFGDGAMGATQAVLATRVLAGDARLLGAMTSAQAVGGVLSGLAAARRSGRLPAVPVVAACFTWFGLADLGLGLYPRWSAAAWPAVVLFGLAGLAVGVHAGVIWALFQSVTEDRLRGRLFAAIWTAASLTAAAGAATAGLLAGRVPAVDILLLPGASALAAAFVFVRTASGAARPAGPPR